MLPFMDAWWARQAITSMRIQAVSRFSVYDGEASKSLDHRPAELLWEQFECMVPKQCHSNLWEGLGLGEGEEFLLDYCNKLATRMPNACKDVIAGN